MMPCWIDAVPLKNVARRIWRFNPLYEQKRSGTFKKSYWKWRAICHRDAFNLDCSWGYGSWVDANGALSVECWFPFCRIAPWSGELVTGARQSTVFDDSHLQVMFSQCKNLVERLQKRGAVVGSSLNTAYLLERLSQTLERLETLMAIFVSNRYLPRRILLLTGCFARAAAEKHSITRLWKQSSRLISRSITPKCGWSWRALHYAR